MRGPLPREDGSALDWSEDWACRDAWPGSEDWACKDAWPGSEDWPRSGESSPKEPPAHQERPFVHMSKAVACGQRAVEVSDFPSGEV